MSTKRPALACGSNATGAKDPVDNMGSKCYNSSMFEHSGGGRHRWANDSNVDKSVDNFWRGF